MSAPTIDEENRRAARIAARHCENEDVEWSILLYAFSAVTLFWGGLAMLAWWAFG